MFIYKNKLVLVSQRFEKRAEAETSLFCVFSHRINFVYLSRANELQLQYTTRAPLLWAVHWHQDFWTLLALWIPLKFVFICFIFDSFIFYRLAHKMFYRYWLNFFSSLFLCGAFRGSLTFWKLTHSSQCDPEEKQQQQQPNTSVEISAKGKMSKFPKMHCFHLMSVQNVPQRWWRGGWRWWGLWRVCDGWTSLYSWRWSLRCSGSKCLQEKRVVQKRNKILLEK